MRCKCASDEMPVEATHWERARTRHGDALVEPVTREELKKALSQCKPGVSAGLDGVTLGGLRVVVNKDDKDRIPRYFTDLLAGRAQVPDCWMLGT